VSPKSTLKHLFGTGKASQVSPNGEVFVRGYRLGWSRMQKELHGVRISAVDMFVNSMLGYGREVQRHRQQIVRSD
jgi:hypothetical protein